MEGSTIFGSENMAPKTIVGAIKCRDAGRSETLDLARKAGERVTKGLWTKAPQQTIDAPKMLATRRFFISGRS